MLGNLATILEFTGTNSNLFILKNKIFLKYFIPFLESG